MDDNIPIHYKATLQALTIAIAMNVPVIIWGMVGQGKALALDTLIPLYDGGYVLMQDIKVGDVLIDSDGNPTRVLEIHPQPQDRPCFRITIDEEVIIADAEHLWLVEVDGSPQTLTTLQLRDIKNPLISRVKTEDEIEGPPHLITKIVPIESEPVQCISVDSPTHTFLITESHIPTHNTSIIKHITTSYGMNLETVIASIREPSDFAGLPFYDPAGYTRLAAPYWAYKVTEEYKANKKVSVIFYDEISTASPLTQAAMLRPLLEGVVGELQLPDKTRSVAAANPPEIAAGGFELTPPVANRFLHLDWVLPASVVKQGFTDGWPLPEMPRFPKQMPKVVKESMSLVGHFIGANQTLATVFPKDFAGVSTGADFQSSSYAFPTPRSWEFAAKLYAGALAARFSDGSRTLEETYSILLKGIIGVAAATEFMSFVKALDLPDPVELLNNPQSFVMPKRGDVLSLIGDNLMKTYEENPSKVWWIALGDIYAKIASAGKADTIFSYLKNWNELRPQGAVLTEEQAKMLNTHLFNLVKGA